MALRAVVNQDSDCMRASAAPSTADVILFGNDSPVYINQTEEFRQYPDKCVVVSNTDLPSYYLPSCYASNRRHFLSHGRAITIPFIPEQRDCLSIPICGHNHHHQYLYSFRGGSTSLTRKKLFKFYEFFKAVDVYVEASDYYHHWSHSEDYETIKRKHQQEYLDVIKDSAFVLCPKGAGASSIRLFEVMQAGRAPVIIADDWIPVKSIPWHDFAIFIQTSNIKSIDNVLRAHKEFARLYGERARENWEKFCSPKNIPWLLRHSIEEIQLARNNKREKIIHFFYPFYRNYLMFVGIFRSFMKTTILRFFYYSGLKFPYKTNRPIEDLIKR